MATHRHGPDNPYQPSREAAKYDRRRAAIGGLAEGDVSPVCRVRLIFWPAGKHRLQFDGVKSCLAIIEDVFIFPPEAEIITEQSWQNVYTKRLGPGISI